MGISKLKAGASTALNRVTQAALQPCTFPGTQLHIMHKFQDLNNFPEQHLEQSRRGQGRSLP